MRVAGGTRSAAREGESRGVLECAQASGVGGAQRAPRGRSQDTHSTHRPCLARAAALYPHCKQTYSHLATLSASRKQPITIFSTNKLTHSNLNTILIL